MFGKITFIVTFTFFVILQNVTTYPLNGDASTTSSVYLGTVDGKSYYADQEVDMSWSAAKTHCIEAGMQLATVTTQAQHDLLKGSYNGVTFNDYYWTAGRDALTMQQFVWDNTGEAPNATIINLDYLPNLQSCISLHLDSAANLHFHGNFACLIKFHVLCEKIDSSHI